MTRSPSPASSPSSFSAPLRRRRANVLSPTLVTLLLLFAAQQCSAAYYGKLIGKLSQLHHGVSGEVYAVDARTLFIKDFTYDGEGPAAWFYVGNDKTVGRNGFKIPDEQGTLNVLKRYRKKDITLSLPEGQTLNKIKWFSVYCEEFSVNFGDVKIPRNFDYPRPQKLQSLSGIHGVSSEPVVVVDAQTLLVPSFSYDGEAPDAKFWVGHGVSPSPQGIRVPDENGREQPLRRYERKTIVLTLPSELTVHQLGHFGVWCEAFAVDFGHVKIPSSLNVPPSLKMLGVSPQSKLNCEVLADDLAFEVRWAVAGDSIVVQLVRKLDENQYMSFGLSADPTRSIMVGGDVVVAWVDKQTLQGYAIDYFLDAKSQCSGGRGSCPDLKIQENTNSVRLLNAAMVNGYSIVTYQRPLKASDQLDQHILTNASQAVIWAVGPLNDKGEAGFHSSYLKGDQFIDFGRPPAWNCPMPELQDQSQPKPQVQHQQQYAQQQPQQEFHQQQQQQQPQHHQQQLAYDNYQEPEISQVSPTTRRPSRIQATPAAAPKHDPWKIPPIECYEPEDGVLYAQMGPTGGIHGYPAITGHVGWGTAWYINGLLIPEIHVVRGKQYTFVVEGGDDSNAPARYHPFYITDDPVGGYQHKSPEEKANVTIFAGVRRQRGITQPIGVGRLCKWVHDPEAPEADEFTSFGGYQRTLTLVCDPGEPGIVQWVPDANTPDTVYYQCYTHRYLGWKIHVHDSCDTQKPAASEVHEVRVEPDNVDRLHQTSDLEPEASMSVSPSKVMPSPEFFQHHQEYNPQDYDYSQKQANHPQLHHLNHQLHHHRAQSTPMNGLDKLITGLNSYNHQLYHHSDNSYKRDPMPLTLVPAYDNIPIHGVDNQRRLPAKISPDDITFVVQTDNPDKDHHHHHHHHHHLPSHMQQREQQATSSLYSGVSSFKNSTNSKVPTFKPLPEYKYPKLVADQYHVSRRPSTVAMNQILNWPMQITYTMPMRVSGGGFPSGTHDSKILQKKMKMRPAQPSPMMILQKKLSQVQSSAFLQAPAKPSAVTQYQGISGLSSQLPNSRPEVFYERKKAVLQAPTVSRIQKAKKPIHPNLFNHSQKPTILAGPSGKYHQPKQKVKVVKTDVGEIFQNDGFTTEQTANFLQRMILKPARNTGFDPKSIVIETGFKPILRMPTDGNDGQARSSNVHVTVERSSEIMQQDERATESGSEPSNDNFGPVFIPSPPDGSLMKKASKKKQFLQTKSKTFTRDNAHAHSNTKTDKTFNRRSSERISSPPEVDSVRHVGSGELRPDGYSPSNSMERTKREAQTQQSRDPSEGHRHQSRQSHAEQDHRLDHQSEQRLTDDTHQASTGEIILANIEYIVLTVVLYYAL